MNLALQRMLGYMITDGPNAGSFAMFRDQNSQQPSVWLTAFVLESLSNANEADWILEFYVSSDLLNKISLFLCDIQHPTGKLEFICEMNVIDLFTMW